MPPFSENVVQYIIPRRKRNVTLVPLEEILKFPREIVVGESSLVYLDCLGR